MTNINKIRDKWIDPIDMHQNPQSCDMNFHYYVFCLGLLSWSMKKLRFTKLHLQNKFANLVFHWLLNVTHRHLSQWFSAYSLLSPHLPRHPSFQGKFQAGSIFFLTLPSQLLFTQGLHSYRFPFLFSFMHPFLFTWK
jgi:hypothetical protein